MTALEPSGTREVGPQYRIRYTEAHLIESFKRYRRQHQHRFWRWALKGFICLCLGALLGFFLYKRLWEPTLIFGVLLVLALIGPQLDFLLIKARFRKSPFHDADVVVQLSERGYLGVDSNSRVELGWQLFTKIRRFADGFLLFTGQQAFYWLPDSALSVGTKEDVEALVKAHVAAYALIE